MKDKKPFIVVERYEPEPDWMLSDFYIDGYLKGVGVEDEKRDQKVKGETAVDNGIYPLDLRYSPKFSKSYYRDENGYLNPTKTDRFNVEHEMIWVRDTPRHEFVLWHWGNTDDDTDACYIVGSTFATFGTQKGVAGSRKKYTDIYPIIFQKIRANQRLSISTYIEYKDKPLSIKHTI